MKLLPLVALALENVRSRLARAALLAVAFAAAMALLTAYLFLRDALVAHADRIRGAMPDLVVSRMVAGRPTTISLAAAEQMQSIPSVGQVRPRVWGYLFSPPIQGNVVVVGTGRVETSNLTPALLAGRDLEAGGEMVLGSHLADVLGLRLGDRLALPSPYGEAPALALVGIVSGEHDLLAGDAVFVREEDARALLGVGAHEATDFALAVKNPAERAVVARTLTDRIAGARVVDRDALGRLYAVAYGWRSGLASACTLPAFLALLFLAAERTSAVSARERREIALQKALGYSTREVLVVRMLEALLVAQAGIAGGFALAYLWVFHAGAFGLRHALFGFGVLQPTLRLDPATAPATLVALSLVVLTPYAGLAVLSAWRVATQDPTTTLRG